MTRDYKTQEQEDAFKEEKRQILEHEIAVHISKGMSREDAGKHVKEVDLQRSEAERCGEVIRDEDGFVKNYLNSDLEPPSTKGISIPQIYAISRAIGE